MDEDVIAGAETAPPADQVATDSPRPANGRRINSTVVIAVGIVILVVVATAIVLFAGGGQATTYPAGSPEAALQTYLRAWYDEDYETAYSYFSTPVRARMTFDEFSSNRFGNSSDGQTVTIDRVTGDGDRRTLFLTVDQYYGPGSSYSRDVSVRMVLEAGSWRINDALAGVDEYCCEEF